MVLTVKCAFILIISVTGNMSGLVPSVCVSQNMKHCVHNLWKKYIILNIVSVVNSLLYCNSVFPLRHFHRHVGTPTWPAATFPHSSSPSNIPLLAPNTTKTYSKRRETESHVGVPTDSTVVLGSVSSPLCV